MTQCPYPFYEAMLQTAPVMKMPDRDEYLVARHEDCLFALRRSDLFSSATIEMLQEMGSAPLGGVPVVRSDPPAHKRKRELISRAFSPSRLEGYRPMIQGHVDRLLDAFVSRGRVEFAAEFASPLPIFVTCDLLGIPQDKYEFVQRWGRLEAAGTRYNSAEHQEAQAKRAMEMGAYIKHVVTERASNPGEDLLSELVANMIARDGELNVPECVAESMVLLGAGLLTTAHMMASTLMLLLQNPEQMRKVRADRRLIPKMFEEGLRMETPVQWVPRVTTQDVELSGVKIPAKTYVLLLLGAANRDERRFGCPASFDIERPHGKQHLGFAQGVHFCLGAPLARMEGKIAFESLFDRVGEMRLVEGANDFARLDSRLFDALTQLHAEFDVVEPCAAGIR
jgi:cytochrome P450